MPVDSRRTFLGGLLAIPFGDKIYNLISKGYGSQQVEFTTLKASVTSLKEFVPEIGYNDLAPINISQGFKVGELGKESPYFPIGENLVSIQLGERATPHLYFLNNYVFSMSTSDV